MTRLLFVVLSTCVQFGLGIPAMTEQKCRAVKANLSVDACLGESLI